MPMTTSHARRIGKKKILVPKKKDADDNQFDDMWQRLSQAIHEIYGRNHFNLSFEELYRNAYNIVVQKMGERLYNNVREAISEHLDEVAGRKIRPAFSNSLSALSNQMSMTNNYLQMAAVSQHGSGSRIDVGARIDDGTRFLKVVQREWDDHTQCMKRIGDILMYMDRVYVKATQLPTVYNMGLDLFRDRVILSNKYPINSYLICVFLDQVSLERDGELVDRMALKACADMLQNMVDSTSKSSNSGQTLYNSYLETKFLESSIEFYRQEGQNLISTCDASEYLKKAEMRLKEEATRTDTYLAASTLPKIRQVVETELIEAHAKTIIETENSGLVAMLTNNKFEDIRRMYSLLGCVENGHKEMKIALSGHIQTLGKAINTQGEESFNVDQYGQDPIEKEERSNANQATKSVANVAVALKWAQDVLELKDKFDTLLTNAFKNDKAFHQAFNQALEIFINQNRRSSEYISLFIDENLKKGLKGKTEQEVESILDKTISLFRFIHDKDVFERYYKSHLTRRLLLARSVSDDSERGMIAKLKVECGYQFTSKLEGMFNDMKLSKDIMTGYREYLDQASIIQSNRLEINVTVLTSTFWPINAVPACNFPNEMAKSCESFGRYYLSRHSGRKLCWHSGLGSVDLRASFNTKRHELNVSTHAAIILLLFNDLTPNRDEQQSLTYSDIRQLTGIPESDLVRNLQSLACAKYKILLKTPKGREVNPGDNFTFNASFSAPLARLKIQTVASKVETEGEQKDTREKVDEARKHQTEAAIVRIMKDRKKMDHNNLISEVTKQLQYRFQPNPAMIKKRIEALIDREYIERSGKDRKEYVYLA